MNRSKTLFRVLQFAICAAIASAVVSCGTRNDSAANNESIAEIQDSLSRGNLEAAALLTDLLKKNSVAANDSLAWSEAMVQQAINSYYQGNPDRLLSSTDSALQWLWRQSVTPKLARILAKACQTRGAYYDQYNFNPDSTARYLRLSVRYAERAGVPRELPQAYGNYANAMRMGAALDSAALYYHRAISVADSLGMPPAEYIPLYNGLAAVFTDMRDFDNSRVWWAKSKEIAGEMNRFDKFNTFTGLGNDLYYQKDYAGSNAVFLELRRMLDSIPDSRWERMFTDVNLADTYLRLDSPHKATALLDSARVYFSTEQPNPVAMSYIHTLLIRDAIENGNMAAARLIADAHPAADSMRLEQQLARLEVLEDFYSASGDYRKAYDMQKHYGHLNDSLRSFTLKERLSAMSAQYHHDRRILNLQAENTSQKARIYRLFASVAIALVVIAGLLLFIVLRRGRLHRREEKMMRKIMSLREENLRNRITPHFICNAINHELDNSVNGLPLHLDAIVGLVRRQQYMFSEILVPFSEELAFVDDYIKVMGDTGRDSIDYSFTITPGLSADFRFPSMALQILVENAFKHGFASLAPGENRILEISVKAIENDRVAISVFNNQNPGSVAAVQESGTGLRVLVETLRLLNERNREKTVFSIDGESESRGVKGYTATITIPLSLK